MAGRKSMRIRRWFNVKIEKYDEGWWKFTCLDCGRWLISNSPNPKIDPKKWHSESCILESERRAKEISITKNKQNG